MNKILILSIVSVLFTGCSLVPTAWRSSRPAGEPAPTLPAEASAEAGQTVEELDAAVTADLETELDVDLDQIETELKAIEEEAGNY